VVGRARRDDRLYTAVALPPPLAVVPPFTLTTDPNPLALDRGGRAKLTVTAVRRGGYDGPIVLEPRNLPAGGAPRPPTTPPRSGLGGDRGGSGGGRAARFARRRECTGYGPAGPRATGVAAVHDQGGWIGVIAIK